MSEILLAALNDEIIQLKTKNEVLRIANTFLLKDAERHRWLRANGYDMGSYHPLSEYNAAAWFEYLDDAAIDAAIADEISSPENPS